MEFKIVAVASFSVCGLTVDLTTSQKENFRLTSGLWKNFNIELRAKSLNRGRNWVKYGVTQKISGGYSYMAAISIDEVIDNFDIAKIECLKFACFQHIGPLSHIKSAFANIYKKTIPGSGLIIDPERTVVHFGRYDERFHWSRDDSIIDIFVPILNKNSDETRTPERD